MFDFLGMMDDVGCGEVGFGVVKDVEFVSCWGSGVGEGKCAAKTEGDRNYTLRGWILLGFWGRGTKRESALCAYHSRLCPPRSTNTRIYLKRFCTFRPPIHETRTLHPSTIYLSVCICISLGVRLTSGDGARRCSRPP